MTTSPDCNSITARLADFVAQKPVEAQDLHSAALFALDAVANIVAGRRSGPGAILCNWAGTQSHANRPHDSGRRALLLGGLCHILEVDDLHRASVVHPGCVVVPAVWALGEADNAGFDGKKALTALLWGFEACTRIGAAVGRAHYKIWHNTATCGPFGAALAAAHLLNLNKGQTVHALGNAGTQAAGLWQFLDTGAMSKHLHAGRAAEAGVVAAELAAAGFTGAPEILEGPRGFFAAMCPDGDATQVLADTHAPWQVHLTSIKPWPSCRHTHPAIDAAQEIRHDMVARGLMLDAVARVDVSTYQAALDLCDRPQPASVYDAKFSLQHTIAAALAYDRIGFAAFEAQERDDLRALRGKITVQRAAGFDRAYPRNWGSEVSVTLLDGSILSASRCDAKGDPEAPLSDREMVDKARDLLIFGDYGEPDRLIDAILSMPAGGAVPRLGI